MNYKEASNELEALKCLMIEEISIGYLCSESSIEAINYQMDGAKKHLETIYSLGMELDSDFNILESGFKDIGYKFYQENLIRHLDFCRNLVKQYNSDFPL